MYTIGQVSEMFDLPVSTLRFYDREGLFPDIERRGGIRRFGERELEALRIIECLKISGLEIREIKQFMQWCTEGSSTYELRRQMFEKRRQAVEEEIRRLQRTLDMLNFKCWYYDTAIADGGEERIKAMLPDRLPPEIQELYDKARGASRNFRKLPVVEGSAEDDA